MDGHVEKMAEAVAAGAREVGGVQVTVKRVPETMPEEAFKKAGGKCDQAAPVADPAELADYDAIIFGTGTRFGNMTGQMHSFLDQTGGLWVKGALVGKVGSVFVSTGTGGGNETRSEEHTSGLQSLMRISYAVFCLKKKKKIDNNKTNR